MPKLAESPQDLATDPELGVVLGRLGTLGALTPPDFVKRLSATRSPTMSGFAEAS